jgi:DNA invertase Pin-like site-specific DNA recombinase
MATVYGYGRHSTNKQGLTEDAQRFKVEGHIQAHLSEHTYGGWLYDRAVSGKKPLCEREEGRKLWVLLQPGDHVVWAKLDRAFRSVIDGASTMQLLTAKGVFIHSLDLGLDTSTAIGRCISTVLLAFAELEREYASQRTKDGLGAKRQKGRPYTRVPPIGWKKVGKKRDSLWLPDPDERIQVQRIVDMREGGASLEQIVLAFKRVNLRRPGGFFWNVNSVTRAIAAAANGFPKRFANALSPLSADA